MRGTILFLSGLIVGAGLMVSVAAQGTLDRGVRLNHVGISVPNLSGRLKRISASTRGRTK